MDSPQKSVRFPKPDEFHPLSNFYSRFRFYSLAVQDRKNEVVVTLAPTNLRRASMQATLVACLLFAFIGLAWLLKPQPLDFARVLGVGATISLCPFYLPFIWRLILRKRLPLLRYDKETSVVHLLGGSRQVPFSEVMAICDVIVQSNGEDSIQTYELQLLLKRQSRKEILLLSGAWHPTAVKDLGPMASSIATSLGIAHLSVNAVDGTLIEQKVGPDAGEKGRRLDREFRSATMSRCLVITVPQMTAADEK